MPTVMLAGVPCGWLCTRPARSIPATATTTAMSIRFMVVRLLVPEDPLLGADPLVEVGRPGPALARLDPGVVRLLGPPGPVVQHPEVDQRLGRVAAQLLELGLGRRRVLVEREHRAVVIDAALGLGAAGLPGRLLERLGRLPRLAGPVLVVGDELVRRRDQVLDLGRERPPGAAEQLAELGRRLGARLLVAAPVAGIGGEELRADLVVGRLE